LPFSDSFSSPFNGAQLSLNWLDRIGNYGVQNNQIVGNSSTTTNLATVNGLALAAVDADADVAVAAGQDAGVVVRYGPTGYYLARIRSTGAATWVAEIMK